MVRYKIFILQLLLVYENVIDFCVLILHRVKLINSLTDSNILTVVYIELSKYRILLNMNTDSFASSFETFTPLFLLNKADRILLNKGIMFLF